LYSVFLLLEQGKPKAEGEEPYPKGWQQENGKPKGIPAIGSSTKGYSCQPFGWLR
jgi:hypothetical protein